MQNAKCCDVIVISECQVREKVNREKDKNLLKTTREWRKDHITYALDNSLKGPSFHTQWTHEYREKKMK